MSNLSQQDNTNTGYLEIILGCMFSGKSTEIIRRANRLISIGKKIMLINHSSDTRYSLGSICSHNKIAIECINVSELNMIITQQQYNKKYMESEFIIIEEAQFFPDLFDFVTTSVDKNKKHMIIAGLDGDYQRKPFGNGDLLRLIPHAENIIKLSSYCQLCTPKLVNANFTRRIIDSNDQCLVGGKDMYIPVCRQHIT